MCIRHIEDKREGQYQLIAKFIDTKIGSKIGNLGISSYMLFKLDYNYIKSDFYPDKQISTSFIREA